VEEGIPLTGKKAAKSSPKPKKSKRGDAAAPGSKAKRRFAGKGKRP
jgi:hypothetical protein